MPVTREYEITYIVDPSLEEGKRIELTAAIDSKIDALQGVISANSESTRRKLAYPIKKQRLGFMRLIQAQLAPDKIAPLRHDVKRMPGILRLAIIESAPRADVTTAIFEVVAKEQPAPATVAAAPKKPSKAVTDEEVEAKIAEALDEEVK